MEVGHPDVIEQVPAGGNPMEPTSGSYGDVVETERLKQQLATPGTSGTGPGGGPVQQPAPTPPGGPGGGPGPAPKPGTLPGALLAPTGQPDMPSSTPLNAGPPPMSQDSGQNQVRLLTALSSSSEASPETREWAKAVLQAIGQPR